jgi:signal peptidase I
MSQGVRHAGRKPDGLALTLILVVAAAILVRTFILDAAVVEGKSMLPHYRNGRVVFIFKAAYGIRGIGGKYLVCWKHPPRGDVVAALRPNSGEMVIKRIGEVRGDRGPPEYFLIGDNGIESIDSRDFGLVTLNAIIGKVLPQR